MNETPRYACPHCSRTFATTFYRRLHLRTTHGVEVSTQGAAHAVEELTAVLAATAHTHRALLARREQS